jgi:class 3 adenylate cyclase
MTDHPSILIADANQADRNAVADLIRELGHVPVLAGNLPETIELARSSDCDMLILDVSMPQMIEVLEQMRADPKLRHVPIVMISVRDDLGTITRCLELGAEGFLYKPPNPFMLRVRVKGCLERKRLHDAEVGYLQQIQAEKAKSDALLRSIFPKAVADRLEARESSIAESFPASTILFADVNRFSHLTAAKSPTEVVHLLNAVFSTFDRVVVELGLEKIKTIGDAYMVASGVPVARPNHAEAAADLALLMQAEIAKLHTGLREPLSLRIGMDSGSVVGGVLGTTRLAYDIWGSPVKGASQMEAYGVPGGIHLTAATARLLREKYLLDERGTFYVKGQGDMTTYLLRAKKSAAPV